MNRKLEIEILEKNNLITKLRSELEDATRKLDAAAVQVHNLFQNQSGNLAPPNEMPSNVRLK
jgi:hypothetical protein